MINFFPLQENVEIEEIYGIKRENATPKGSGKTFVFDRDDNKSRYIYSEPQEYQWFKENEISKYEINFFGKLEEKEYLTIRNYIIDKYKEEFKFISLKSIALEGISSFRLVYKIYSFLEKLKIINNRDILHESKVILSKMVGISDAGEEAYLSKDEAIEKQEKQNESNSEDFASNASNLFVKENIYCSNDLNSKGDEDSKERYDAKNLSQEEIKDPKKHVSLKSFKYDSIMSKRCNCGLKSRYFSLDDTFLCDSCYKKGKYPIEKSSCDFNKIDDHIFNKIWNKKEEIKLLEAVDKCGDDWVSVSKYIGTKSKHECIYHFINIPIQENNLSRQNFSIYVPFLTTSNTIMYYVSFLSSVVHPSVGAAAARVAIKEISYGSGTIFKSILLETKEKAKELFEIENKKIHRCNKVIEEGLINLIELKIRAYKDLNSCVDRVRNELVVLRNKMIEGSDEDS